MDKYYRGNLSKQDNIHIGQHFTIGMVEIAMGNDRFQVHYNSKCFFEIGTPFYKAFTVCLQIELTPLYL